MALPEKELFDGIPQEKRLEIIHSWGMEIERKMDTHEEQINALNLNAHHILSMKETLEKISKASVMNGKFVEVYNQVAEIRDILFDKKDGVVYENKKNTQLRLVVMWITGIAFGAAIGTLVTIEVNRLMHVSEPSPQIKIETPIKK